MRSMRGHAGVITDLSISCENALLATASEDRLIRIWNVSDGTPLVILHGHTDTINYVHFHPFLPILLTGSDDGTARAWDLSAMKEAGEERARDNDLFAAVPPYHPVPAIFQHVNEAGGATVEQRARVKCISICPYGSYVATGADDGVGRVWSLIEIEKKASPTVPASSDAANAPHMGVGTRRRQDVGDGGGGAAAAAAAAGGGGAAGGGEAPAVAHLVCRLTGHKKTVTDINYSHTGDRLFSGSMSEGIIRVWSWAAGYTNLTHFVLNMTTTLEEDAKTDAAAEAEEERHKRKTIPGCDNALWTCDDKMIITSQSTRPEDAVNGNWKHCLKVRTIHAQPVLTTVPRARCLIITLLPSFVY